jgi:hypothetical protein
MGLADGAMARRLSSNKRAVGPSPTACWGEPSRPDPDPDILIRCGRIVRGAAGQTGKMSGEMLTPRRFPWQSLRVEAVTWGAPA